MDTETAIVVHMNVFDTRFSAKHFSAYYLKNNDLCEKDVRSIWIENNELNIALK